MGKDSDIPKGKAIITIVKAKDLLKSDIIGKSDPYVKAIFGRQNKTSPVVKNTQNPEWNYDADFDTPEGKEQNIKIEVFDKDKIGKDKSLGWMDLSLQKALKMDGNEGHWFNLEGVKSGKILLMADFIDNEGFNSKGQPSSLLSQQPLTSNNDGGDWRNEIDPSGKLRENNKDLIEPEVNRNPYSNEDEDKYLDDKASRKPSSISSDKRKSSGMKDVQGRDPYHDALDSEDTTLLKDSDIPKGKAIITIVKAKDLLKSDIIGKSDPYVKAIFGRQNKTSPVVKNTQNPEWNYEADFDTPEGKEQNIKIEVFDKDKIGKDKSLGWIDLSLQKVLKMDGNEGHWFNLEGVKSGKILLMADFIDNEGF